MTIKKNEISAVMFEISDARQRLIDLSHKLEGIARQNRNISLKEALATGLVKFNFAVNREMVKAIVKEYEDEQKN